MTDNNLIPFTFEGKDVRVVTQNNEPWWVLSDVCDVLEHSNSRKAGERLDADEKADVNISYTSSNGVTQRRNVTTINESGLWSLVLTSRKAEAKRFKKWLTSEVIPSIRKHGGYMVAEANETPEQLALRAMQVLQSTVERQKVQISSMQDDVDVLARIAKADGSLCVTEAAKVLEVRPKSLFDYLHRNGWIYRRNGSGNWLGYARHCTAGDLEHRVRTEQRPDGSEVIREQVRLTPQGMTKLAKIFLKEGVTA